MRINKIKLLLLLCLAIWASMGLAVITDYTFASNTGTYTEITGGTTHGTAANDDDSFNAVPIGFSFNYNGTDYTEVSISSNGFIAMGATVVNSFTAISTGTSNNVIVPLNRDLRSRPNGTLTSIVSGTAPSRIFTVQWQNYQRYHADATNDVFNFQIKLYEANNAITFNYGSFTAVDLPTFNTVQVGLRGASNTEYINRSTTTDWTATTAGTASNATCVLNAAIVPPTGLTFTWAPPGAFPAPTSLIATGGATGITLTWIAPDPLHPNLAGYRIFRNGINITPSPVTATLYTDNNIVNGVTYSYYVVAVYTNPNGISAPSNTASAAGGENMLPVYNLQYSVAANAVSLTWTPPGGPIYQDWINYDDGTNSNAIGTGDEIVFEVAARFTQTELSAITDRYLTKVRFYPAEASASYSIKIYTGGTSYLNPGTLSLNYPVTAPTINAWNIVDLPAPIQIPSTGELWVSIGIDTPTGYPAGCDDGPSIPYKGNMIFFNDEWTILTELNEDLDFNWNIQAFVTNYIGRETVLTPLVASLPEPVIRNVSSGSLTAISMPQTEFSVASRDLQRPLSGYRVYRDDEPIHTINSVIVSNYTDTGLENGSYTYFVTALYTTGESLPCDPVTATVNVVTVPIALEDGFESYPDFTTDLGSWRNVDLDQSATLDIDVFDFPGEGNPMAYMVFNPETTTPPFTVLTAHTGIKMLTCFPATTPPNNDWLMTPRLRLGTVNSITFWARSIGDSTALARFRCGISTAQDPIPASFTWLSGPNYIQPPFEWTQYSYPVPTAFNAQRVFYGIKCETNGGSTLLIDDIKIQGYSVVENDDDVISAPVTALLGNYPNPFNPETAISFSLKAEDRAVLEVYNMKGQKVRTLLDGNVRAGMHTVVWTGDDDNGKPASSGVYFYKLSSGKYSSTKKMILLK
jgi:hypothetical protein